MRMNGKIALGLAVSLLVLLAIACGVSNQNGGDEVSNDSQDNQAQIARTTPEPTSLSATIGETSEIANFGDGAALELENRLIGLYNKVNPSVVHIIVYSDQGDTFPLGSGSGFVYDDMGRIVTNNHVVEDGADFEIIFADGSRRKAEVIGKDVDSDLAVMAVDSLPDSALPVTLGNSDQLLVGQLVIAIGNPFEEQGSMTLGIVSGLGRILESQRQPTDTLGRYSLPEVIQTDAPINPGNSGGPLLNIQGEVVGVNSAIRTTTGVNSGVGFSIPVNAVHRIIPKLIEDGEYTYSYMGVQIQSLNLNLQEQFDLPQYVGAYVTDVTPGSPAEEAGLIPARQSDRRGGDLIVAIDGQTVQDTEGLIAYLVFNTEVGQTVDLTVLRDGETITVPLTLGARP